MIRRSITAKMSALVVIPLVALIGLWLFATGLTIGPARDLRSAETLGKYVGDPARDVVARLQAERRLTVVRQGLRTAGVPTAEIDAAIVEQRRLTDAAISRFTELSGNPEVAGAVTAAVASRLDEFQTAIAGLPTARTGIEGPRAGRAAIMHIYTGLIDSAYHLFSPLAEVDDPELGRLSRTLLGLSRAREFAAQEDALISGVIAAGKLSLSDITEISGAIGAQRRLFADAAQELPPADAAAYARMRDEPAFGQLARMEDMIIRDGREGRPLPIDPQVWRTSTDTIMELLRAFETQAKLAEQERAVAVARSAYLKLALTGMVGLGAVLVALWIGLRVARSVTRRLRRLRDVATDLAEVELPQVVGRLRRGEQVDVTDAERALRFGLDEIGEVGNAFGAVRRTAVHAAIDEATLRHGLNEVFLNVARRSQTLLHRQLTLLDKMERRSQDPKELEDLFRLDHLATRMRRHAEDLVILAGGAPGRGWRHPVPAVDVVRGAVSEIEEYIRVTVERVPAVAIAGRAVGDIIHLIAELVENGTAFSPPHTRVTVYGELVPIEDGGYNLAIGIEDRGLGMSEEALAEANERLATPPDFDPANSARLGLLVVARLAARHGISVRLRRSPHGGVAALVEIPEELVTEEVRRAPKPSVVRATASAAIGIPAAATSTFTTDTGAEATGSVPTGDGALEGIEATETLGAARARAAVPGEGAKESDDDRRGDGGVPAAEASGDGLGGLPKRRRGAGPVEPGPVSEPASETARDPQRVRATMSAFQSGSANGRSVTRRRTGTAPEPDEPVQAAASQPVNAQQGEAR